MSLPLVDPTKSYWIEAAESPLRDFRSSDGLPAETDIAIIGSGYAGASTAYWIHKYTENSDAKPRILMLEARDICGSATGRNGGQLRPHLYSRYLPWKERFGADGAMELIRHEHAHLSAFKHLADQEGFADEVCLKFGETFDAAMTEEAWIRLRDNLEAMKKDHGKDDEIVKACRLITDAHEAEEFSQMKGAIAAVVHPAGQIWPYKFAHALLRKVLASGQLNLQAHTPAQTISERDADGWITVTTDRGVVKARTVVHTTNRWASHLLPEFTKLILGDRATMAAIKAPEGFIRHTGAQHWDSVVNNYHLQLPPPHNTIILGGGRQLLVHRPHDCFLNDEEDKQVPGMAEFFRSWPSSDVKGWPNRSPPELALDVNNGGCWTGMETTSIDSFPFVGSVPNRVGHWIAAGFAGHGMPRILLSTAHITPLLLKELGFEHSPPSLVQSYPSLPKPFHATAERVERLQQTADVAAKKQAYLDNCEASAKKPFCNTARTRLPN
ncbi:FAD dependent oxidoreductase [Lecanosticta acicola]|uniref:FAD dependent oxidoreductase n=1 Tax=Lecanosticta acicola TaxID=111012 RepID=A0AAI8YVG9_9PEZI|nr:FAD dependent oxidoreductase [Lecanosticta acicola]